MKFDPKKPHGLVYGVPGAAYEQGGQLYSPTGEPVEEVAEEDDFPIDKTEPTKTVATPASTAPKK